MYILVFSSAAMETHATARGRRIQLREGDAFNASLHPSIFLFYPDFFEGIQTTMPGA